MLPPDEIRRLKSLAHPLRPIILIGAQGLTPAVDREIDRALFDHELIKIKISGSDKEQRKSIAETICTTHDAEFIQLIGHIVVIYRKSTKVAQKLSRQKKTI